LAHEQNPLSNDTIDSVLRHREVGRAKDLSAPLVHFDLQSVILMTNYQILQSYTTIFLAVNHLIIIDMFQTSGSLSRFLHLDIYLGLQNAGGI